MRKSATRSPAPPPEQTPFVERTPSGTLIAARDPARFVVGPVLGTGGMATVHLGVHLGCAGFRRVCAVKRVHKHLLGDLHIERMFIDEAMLAARVNHPNVVSVLDVVSDGGELLLVMEYVQGVSLTELLRAFSRKGERVPQDVAVAIACDVLYGLHAAHEAVGPTGEPLGIIHRDVSPQNIMVGADGVARIADFGVAWAKRRREQTDHGIIKGKLTYMPAEQLLGEPLDPRADVYSMALVVWEMLTGEKPFDAADVVALVQQKLHHPMTRATELRRSVHDSLDGVVQKSMARARQERHASAMTMARDLETCCPRAPRSTVASLVRRACSELLDDRLALLREVELLGTDHEQRARATPMAICIDVDLADDFAPDEAKEPPSRPGARPKAPPLPMPPPERTALRAALLAAGVAFVLSVLVGGAVRRHDLRSLAMGAPGLQFELLGQPATLPSDAGIFNDSGVTGR
jgi:serine/threonine protein kinase